MSWTIYCNSWLAVSQLLYIWQFISHCIFCMIQISVYTAVHELLLLLQFMDWYMYILLFPNCLYIFCRSWVAVSVLQYTCTYILWFMSNVLSKLLLVLISCCICYSINFTVHEYLLQVPCYWGGTVCTSCCWQSMVSQSASTSPLWVKKKLIGTM